MNKPIGNLEIDWGICCICQEKNGEQLSCPAVNPIKANVGAGYLTIAENLNAFSVVDSLSPNLKKLTELGSENLYNVLLKNEAKWHKKCAAAYNKVKLQRVKRKRALSLPSTFLDSISQFSPTEDLENKKPRLRKSSDSRSTEEICFICNDKGSTRSVLFNIASLQDNKLQKCAKLKNDIALQSFLQGGDLVAKEAKYHAKCYTNLTNSLRKPAISETPTAESKVDDANNNLRDDDDAATEKILQKIRQDIAQVKTNFDGNLSTEKHGVPSSLLSAIHFLMYGNSEYDTAIKATHPALNICQLIIFNYSEKSPKGAIIRHQKVREPPLPVYVGLSIYGKTRNKTVIDNFHERGISISSNRIREITAGLCRVEVDRAQAEGVVCPEKFKHDQFVIAAYDNIDHNYSSTTAENSFHGTAISLFQLPSAGKVGKARDYVPPTSLFADFNRSVPELPRSYSFVKPLTLRSKEPATPKADERTLSSMLSEHGATWTEERSWLNRVDIDSDIKDDALDISWAAFHASKANVSSAQEACGSLLPLFYESSTSVAMVKHGMEQIKKITAFLNPTQTPILCFDQPLFAVAKCIQWNWPDELGESKFVTLFAPFHVEQAFLKLLGQLLVGSGWLGVVAHSGIKTEAGAESCLKVTHVTKARAVHEKTAVVLYTLLKSAFLQESPDVSFDEWIEKKSQKCPTFKFWMLVLNLEILLLSFVRSLRSGDYDLFVSSLKKMTPWFFFFDHIHYARWLTVHVKDLQELQERAPEVHAQFSDGNFVIRKSSNPFSAIAVDQAHEQNNAVIKGTGGAIGLLHDAAMLRRWMLCGPQLMSVLEDFEANSETVSKKALHHEQYPSFQAKFHAKVRAFKESFLQFGNPFQENSADLLVWDSKVVMDKARVDTLYKAEKTASDLYKRFTRERLSEEAKINIFHKLTKNGAKIFGFTPKKRTPPAVMADLKNDVELFSRAFIVSQNRELDLDSFFKFENARAPPSLSSNGALRPSTKAQLLKILEESAEQPAFEENADAIIYDGAALVHSIFPRSSKTFGEYMHFEFKNRIVSDIKRYKSKRIHISWDMYSSTSLKKYLREKRGDGVRRRVSSEYPVPKNWQDFLCCDANKEELFSLLGNYALHNFPDVIVTTEVDSQIISSHPDQTSVQGVKCRMEEEADSRIFLHAQDCAQFGSKKVIISTVDTDVVVLAISFATRLKRRGLEEICIQFGNGAQQRFISINPILLSIGAEKAEAMRGFHAFSGCDLTSSFSLRGKPSAWSTWKLFPEATAAFLALGSPEPLTESCIQILEKFTGRLYYSKAADIPLHLLRKFLFTTKNRALHNLPPTKGALKQHTLRAAYQAGQVWGRALSPKEEIPGPEKYGWMEEKGNWSPIWSNLPSIWDGCRELVKCNCKSVCTKRCSCVKAQVPCTLICTRCSGGAGHCGNEFNTRNDSGEDANDAETCFDNEQNAKNDSSC